MFWFQTNNTNKKDTINFNVWSRTPYNKPHVYSSFVYIKNIVVILCMGLLHPITVWGTELGLYVGCSVAGNSLSLITHILHSIAFVMKGYNPKNPKIHWSYRHNIEKLYLLEVMWTCMLKCPNQSHRCRNYFLRNFLTFRIFLRYASVPPPPHTHITVCFIFRYATNEYHKFSLINNRRNCVIEITNFVYKNPYLTACL